MAPTRQDVSEPHLPVDSLSEKRPLRQVNIWMRDDDLAFLRQLAAEREQSVSALLRRAIATWRRAHRATSTD